jgi:hypothetical protein
VALYVFCAESGGSHAGSLLHLRRVAWEEKRCLGAKFIPRPGNSAMTSFNWTRQVFLLSTDSHFSDLSARKGAAGGGASSSGYVKYGDGVDAGEPYSPAS